MAYKSKFSLKRKRDWQEDVEKLESRMNYVDMNMCKLNENQCTQSDEDIDSESDYSIQLTSYGNGCQTTCNNSLIVECHDSTQGQEFDHTFASFMQDGYKSDDACETKESPTPVKHKKQDIVAESEGSDFERNVRTFVLQVKNMVIVILSHPFTVSFDGMALICVISGKINIHGCELKPSDQFIPIYSARGLCPLDITTMESEKICRQAALLQIVREKLCDVGVGEKFLSDILDSCDNSSVIFVLKRNCDAKPIEFVCSVKPQTLTFKTKKAFDLLGCGFNISPIQENLQLDFSSAEKLVEDILSYNNKSEVHSGKASKVIVQGNKYAGKSTLLRYLVNNALNRVDRVYYLDLDPGQTEFTPPGCLSLVQVSAPLLGPPFTHQSIPEKMFFLGRFNVKEITDDYIFYVESLCAYYRELHSKVPLFVNTMGWTKGEGVVLLQKIKTILKPSHVIRIERAVPDSGSSPGFESGRESVSSPVLELHDMETSPDLDEHNYTIYRNSFSATEVEEAYHSGRPSPSLRRDLAVLAYLGRCQKLLEFCPLNAIKPYRVAWKHIALHILYDSVDHNQMFYALNATWVALCTVDESLFVKYEEEALPKFLAADPVGCECHGFGLIRNIEPEKKFLYIITPEPPVVLKKVNTLIRGEINIPVELIINEETKDGSSAPYVKLRINK